MGEGPSSVDHGDLLYDERGRAAQVTLADAEREPLLFKGDDFARTDIQAA